MNGCRWFAALTLSALLLAACSTGAPPEAAAEQLAASTRHVYSGAGASFVEYDDCLYTHVQVYADNASWRNEPGRPHRSNFADVFVYQAEMCSGWETLVSGWGWAELDERDFSMTGNLGRARLRKSVDVYDWASDTTIPVRLDLTWSGVGDLWSWTERQHQDEGNVKLRFRYGSKGRSADVSGDVDVGGLGIIVPMPGAGWMSTQTYASTSIVTRRPTAPTIQYFDAYPNEVFAGGIATLSWWVSGSEPITLTIDHGVGDVTGSSFVSVSPAETTTYTLTASNSRGTDRAQFTIYVVPPPEPDWREENDDPASATPIVLDFYADDLTITPGDVDWFTFTIDAAATVYVDMWPSSHGFYPLVALYDAALDQVAAYGWWFEAHLASGTYYVAVTAEPDYGFSGHHAAAGHYTLNVSALLPPEPDEFEPNDEAASATPITLDFYRDLTITPHDVDWFTFTLDAQAFVEINLWLGGGNLSPRVSLFDGGLGLVTPYAAWFRDLLPAGTYYLAVTDDSDHDFTGDHSAFGSYGLVISAAELSEPDAFEPNDTPAEATVVTLDHISPRLTITPHDVDWFTFTLTTSGTLIADVDASDLSSPLDAMLGLFDVHLDLVAFNDDYWSLDPRIETHLTAGTYFLAVTAYSDFEFEGSHTRDGFYFLTITTTP
jgi:hypothetical protein